MAHSHQERWSSARFSWQAPEEETAPHAPARDEPARNPEPAPPAHQHTRAYSYVQTPIEHRQPSFHDAHRLSFQPSVPQLPQIPSHIAYSTASPLPSSQNARSEKSDYHQYVDPNAGHPALYIPPGFVQAEPQHQFQNHAEPPSSLPHSPGPLPIKSRLPESPNDYPPQTVTSPTVLSPDPNYVPHSPGPLPIKSRLPESPNDYSSQPAKSPTTISPDLTYLPHTPSHPTHNLHTTFSPDAAHGVNGPVHNPGQITHPNMDLSSGGAKQSWKHSLCECNADVSTCLTGLFCPCILYGKTAYRLNQKAEKRAPTDLLGWKKTNRRCGVMSVACGLWCLFPILQRSRIRRAYNLLGSTSDDLLSGCCCCCCAVIQNEREVRDREEDMRRWAGPSMGEVYTSPGQMVYAPPPRR